MRFADIVRASDSVARTSGRLEKVRVLTRALQQLAAESPADIEAAVAFLSGSVRQGRVGLGHAVIHTAADVPAATAETLTIAEVDAAFGNLASTAGHGAGHRRAQLLHELLARATSSEQDFLRRLLYGELRQGALEGVLSDAVAQAASLAPERVRRASMITGSLVAAAKSALTGGALALEALVPRVMQPLQPMLAQSADDVAGALAALGDATLEYKLDGARIQVHKSDDQVRIFSRTLNDVTTSLPEVVAAVRAMSAGTLVLDGEVIALRADGRPHPFQTTMRRFGRTKDVATGQLDLPLTPFFFDCLHLDAMSLIDETQEQRIGVLQDVAGPFTVPRIVRPTMAEANAFAHEALARGHEGILAKDLAAPYAAGRRGAAWLKVKEARTLDLVVLAAEWGNGRRRGWLSNLHLGARDPDSGGFVMLGKTFKGMTDEMLAWQTAHLLSLETARDRHVVFVRPALVVEIAFNEVQVSPTYPGGLALRFARVKRYRLDKHPADADTVETVRQFAPG